MQNPGRFKPHSGIPTSHFATAQLDCTATITEEIRRFLADQLATMQTNQPRGKPTRLDAPYERKLRQIRGLELTVNSIRAKFNFSGETDEVRQQMIDGHRVRNEPGDTQALGHLLRQHPTTDLATTSATTPLALGARSVRWARCDQRT